MHGELNGDFISYFIYTGTVLLLCWHVGCKLVLFVCVSFLLAFAYRAFACTVETHTCKLESKIADDHSVHSQVTWNPASILVAKHFICKYFFRHFISAFICTLYFTLFLQGDFFGH